MGERLTLGGLARFAGVCTKTLKMAIKRGRLRATRRRDPHVPGRPRGAYAIDADALALFRSVKRSTPIASDGGPKGRSSSTRSNPDSRLVAMADANGNEGPSTRRSSWQRWCARISGSGWPNAAG